MRPRTAASLVLGPRSLLNLAFINHVRIFLRIRSLWPSSPSFPPSSSSSFQVLTRSPYPVPTLLTLAQFDRNADDRQCLLPDFLPLPAATAALSGRPTHAHLGLRRNWYREISSCFYSSTAGQSNGLGLSSCFSAP